MLEVFDSNEFRRIGHKLIDDLSDYLSQATQGSAEIVVPYVDPEETYQYWKKDFEEEVGGDINKMFNTVINQSTKLHHPRYMGHQVGVISPLSALSSVVTSILNNGQAVYEMGMPGNAMERIVTELMCNKIGYSNQSGGFLTSGGTIATLTALLAARANKTNVWEEGSQHEKLAIMVSIEAHYAVDRAARIMGLGSEGIIKIPVNDQLQIDVSKLEKYHSEATEKGYNVFALIGSVCSTSSGSYDDLEILAEFAQKHNIWLHADGAHGGAVIFSQKYNGLVKGINLCDSVVIDWHKMLMIPALITAVLFKHDKDAYQTFHQRAQYLWSDPSSLDWYNSGKRTIECTKLMMSLKVYTLVKTHGIDALGRYVDYTYDLARAFHNHLLTLSDFESLVHPESNIVCFRKMKNGLSQTELNHYNAKIRKSLLLDGRFYIVQTLVRENLYLRVTLMNPFTTIDDLKKLLTLIEEFAQE